MEHTREWFNNHKSFYGDPAANSCTVCGEKENLHLHHILALAKGGTNFKTNVVWMCGDCHGKVHDKRFGVEWKDAQAAGIARAKAEGKYNGRAKAQKPANWDVVITAWTQKKINANTAMALLNMKRTTFYKYIKEWDFEETQGDILAAVAQMVSASP